MFRRGSSCQGTSDAPSSSTQGHQEVQAAGQQDAASSSTARTVAAIRGQQQARQRSSGGGSVPTLADLRSRGRSSAQQRSRVQQSGTDQPDGTANTGSSRGMVAGIRSRLMPLQASAGQTPPAAPGAGAQQHFSVFTNPLSSAAAPTAATADSSSQQPRSRAAASIQQPAEDTLPPPEKALQQQGHAVQGITSTVPADVPAAALQDSSAEQHAAADASNTSGVPDAAQAVASSTAAGKDAAGQLSADGLQRTYRFEVHAAAGSEPEQLIDYNGHDQHHEQLYSGEDLMQQQHGANIQQYVYDEVGWGALQLH